MGATGQRPPHSGPAGGGLSRRGLLRRTWRWGLAAALLGGAGWEGSRELRGWGQVPRPDWTLPLPRPILGAHRGGRALFPENTLEAFRSVSQRYGCRYLELDVRASAEGVPVVIHDATVDRTTDGSGPVNGFRLADLQRLDAAFRFRNLAGEPEWAGRGVRIPTLEAVLRAFPGHVVSVEIKQQEPPIEAAVAGAIRATGMQRQVVVGSARDAVCRRLKALAPELATFYSRRAGLVFFLALWSGLIGWYVPRHNMLAIPPRLGRLRLVTPAMLRAARRLEASVMVWTVNDPADMERLLALGVDGIITDRPDLLAPLIAARPRA
jgi:glycerophosphoryl diester phosphodiesterase